MSVESRFFGISFHSRCIVSLWATANTNDESTCKKKTNALVKKNLNPFQTGVSEFLCDYNSFPLRVLLRALLSRFTLLNSRKRRGYSQARFKATGSGVIFIVVVVVVFFAP